MVGANFAPYLFYRHAVNRQMVIQQEQMNSLAASTKLMQEAVQASTAAMQEAVQKGKK